MDFTRKYETFLIASDFAIQLRTFGFGGLSGAVLDCISAGIPTVVNNDLAESTNSPDYILRINDHISALLIAENIYNGFNKECTLQEIILQETTIVEVIISKTMHLA